MLRSPGKDQRFAGKLMLTSALVAVSVGYAWWQHGMVSQERAAAITAMQMPAAPAPQAETSKPAAPQTAAPGPETQSASGSAAPPAAAPGAATLAMAAPRTAAPQTAAPPSTAASGQVALLPATPPPAPLTGMAAIQNFIPVEGVSPPLPVSTGTPDPGAAPPIPAGSHLEDGEYESDRVQFEWGDLRVKIIVTGSRITGVQIVTYPDHRSQSLYLIQLADPILNSEVIKTQQAKVDIVSTATNSSYAYQDAIANAIMKATR